MTNLLAASAAIVLATLAACSAQEVYDSAQGARVEECARLLQQNERLDCEERARVPYGEAEKKHDPAADPK